MRLWLLASDGDVYETSTHAVSVPALGSSGEFVMVVALLLTVLYVGRRGLLPSTE
jgi:hypothetical protein